MEEMIFPDEREFNGQLSEIFDENNLSKFVTERSLSLLYSFTKTLWQTNKSLNLTALTNVKDMILKHLADSLLVAGYFEDGASIIDVGCGGGFPTFPLAIARPDLKITALDSTEKKVNFVRNTAKELGLSNVNAVCGRAEELAAGAMREAFDYATARAVAALPILSELCIPFVKVGGRFVAMKSLKIEEELELANKKDLFSILGCAGSLTIDTLKLSDGGEELFRSIAVAKKVSPTPKKYPRAYSQIVKNCKKQ